jgi:phosphoenolpyruvate carboxykinase (ATP)
VPADVLDPRATWGEGAAYDQQAQRLAAMFRENFAQFAADVSADVQAAGPRAF